MAQSGTVTLLFTDLVNSTAQLQQAGDESGAHLFQTHHKLMTDAIASAGGEELQWLGDGLLAAFPSTADAVRCAIGIQQTARRPTARTRFEIRIGIHCGEVMRRDGSYFGLPVVAARRLCDRASPGQILCSNLIAELLASRQNFEFRDCGDLRLRDLPTPVGVCEVVYQANDPAAMLHRTPFVGRNPQLERLSAKLGEALNGRGSVAMVRGEPGIGKTRMLEEFTDRAREGGAVVLRGACYDGEWQPPYGPFAGAIADYAHHAERATLAAVLSGRASIIARISPALSEILGPIPEPMALSKEEERFRLFDAVAQFLIAVSQRTPLVLILDDLHWADRGVIAMLNHVVHFIPDNPILVIGAYREAEVDRKHPLAAALAAISRQRNFESLTLKGLQGDELADLLELVGDQDVPESLIEGLEQATNGNPLFIRELLLHLLEEGKILRAGQGWMAKLSVGDLGIPEGVRQVISSRLLRLSENANRLLTVASAFNGAFSLGVAASVADLDEAASLAAIDEALEAELLRPGANSESFDFTHAIIRHTVYSELNSARSVRLHRKIAEEMEHAWGEQAGHHAAEVAYQFWRGAAAKDSGRGASYAIAAADNAEAAYAHDEVASFLRIALDLVGQDDPRRPRLLARLGFALTWTLTREEARKTACAAGVRIAAAEGTAAAADYYERIARAMFNAGDALGAWELAKQGMPRVRNRRDITWASLTAIDINRAECEDPGNPGITIDSAENHQLNEVLRRLPREQLAARNIEPIYLSREEIISDPSPPARVAMRGGDIRLALSLWQQEAAECERCGAIARATRAWSGVGRCHNALGNFVDGAAALDRAVSLSARFGRPTFASVSLTGTSTEIHIAMNENWEQLLRTMRGYIGLPPDSDLSIVEAVKFVGAEAKWTLSSAISCMAYVYACMNQPDRALQLLSELPEAFERGAPWDFNYVMTAAFAAGALWVLNRTDHVEVFERNIRDKVVSPDLRWTMTDGRLSLARLCALQRRYDEASEWFVKARVVLSEQGARPLRAIADYDEALMYLRRGEPGDRARARPLLTVALLQFNALGMRGWTRAAEAGLAEEPL